MLEANKSIWFEKIYAFYNRNLLKRRFHSFHVQNFQPIKTRNKSIPLIIFANHSSWWDGLILFELLKSREFDLYVMMEEKQLKNLKLFRRLGAFSIVRENPSEALQSINYAVKVLNFGINKTLLIFPQGEILPNDKRPIKFFNGLSFLLGKLSEFQLVPCSIRFEFQNHFKPEIYVRFGKMELHENFSKIDRKLFTRNLENKMTENLDALKSVIIKNDLRNFVTLF